MMELVVIITKDADGVFSASVLQEGRIGPNLLRGKIKNLLDAEQKAKLRLRKDGFTGEIRFEHGYPKQQKTVADLPVSTARDNYGIKSVGAYRNNTPGVKP